MRDWLIITLSFAAMGAVAVGLGLSMYQHEGRWEEPTCRLQERIDYCNMVWGDSKHFATCMRGERVIPSSGR